MLAASASAALLLAAGRPAAAHPLGNFTINHYGRLEVGAARVAVRYVVDLAEIPTYQAMQALGADSSGLPAGVLSAYGERMAVQYGDGIALTVDGVRVPLRPAAHRVSMPAGSGGLPTLRLELDLAGALPAAAGAVRHLRYEDTNQRDRIGWNEIVVGAAPGVSLFDSSAFGSALTDELRAYPDPTLTGTLDERSATLSFTSGPAPAGAAPLARRDGTPSAPSRDRFVELISVPELTSGAALLGLLFAALLGGLHALSPGHGKTVVGAYLVGARGTARHAAFLGLTVTVTHTLGVFALGLVTLFAAHYVVPERLFPVLSFTSGALIAAMGLTLFVTRLRAAVGAPLHRHRDHDHDHGHAPHAPGGRVHSHLPPGADGSPVTWRNLLALGISGGILPCPSALVVLLAAIALNRVGYGLLLIVAFSAGLAGVLTAVGLAFVYASRLVKRPRDGRWAGALPVLSALVVAAAGAAICWDALRGAGIDPTALLRNAPAASPGLLSTVSVLGLGLLFGLKHAFEADHVAAVSIIVSERRSFWSSSLVGAVWGVGHTISLLAAGVLVILLHVEISDRVALGLEFCVALMLIGLGANALRTLRRGGRLHLHAHAHGDRLHLHPHLHDPAGEPPPHTHHRVGVRPLVVGMVHGLAGSAALMLLVLSSIPSPLVGFAYIGVFGIGSIGGMLGVSALMTVPVHFTATRFARTNTAVRMLAALFSLAFGLSMAYQIGVVDGLLL
jgi:ABC-type nickel/cobalt efflux system permease component RcnA